MRLAPGEPGASNTACNCRASVSDGICLALRVMCCASQGGSAFPEDDASMIVEGANIRRPSRSDQRVEDNAFHLACKHALNSYIRPQPGNLSASSAQSVVPKIFQFFLKRSPFFSFVRDEHKKINL